MKMILSSLLLVTSFSSFAQTQQQEPQLKDMLIPAKEIASYDIPQLIDDGDISLLLKALARQESAFKRKPLTGELVIGGQRFPMSILQRTLTAFKQIVEKLEDCRQIQRSSLCQQNFEDDLKTYFRW